MNYELGGLVYLPDSESKFTRTHLSPI